MCFLLYGIPRKQDGGTRSRLIAPFLELRKGRLSSLLRGLSETRRETRSAPRRRPGTRLREDRTYGRRNSTNQTSLGKATVQKTWNNSQLSKADDSKQSEKAKNDVFFSLSFFPPPQKKKGKQDVVEQKLKDDSYEIPTVPSPPAISPTGHQKVATICLIRKEDLAIEEKELGRGEFSTVKRATWTRSDNGTKVINN